MMQVGRQRRAPKYLGLTRDSQIPRERVMPTTATNPYPDILLSPGAKAISDWEDWGIC
jgi:hypothetical protein